MEIRAASNSARLLRPDNRHGKMLCCHCRVVPSTQCHCMTIARQAACHGNDD